MERDVTLSVFFCGTSSCLENGYTQISTFYKHCRGFVLEGSEQKIDLTQTEYKMGFDGCGVTHGAWGGFFGYGLEEQCWQVAGKVKILLENGKKVTIIGLGLSRGAIALLLLAQILQREYSKVVIKMVLFDPVPGNLIYQAKFDLLGLTNTSLSRNLSLCENVTNVLTLYTVEPMPDLAFHAPLIPLFSTKTLAEWDVVPGMHQGAFFDAYHSSTECFISYYLVREKLEKFGMPLEMEVISPQDENAVWECLEKSHQEEVKSERYTHSYDNALIVRELNGTYLNKYHQQLSNKRGIVKREDPESLYQCFIWVK